MHRVQERIRRWHCPDFNPSRRSSSRHAQVVEILQPFLLSRGTVPEGTARKVHHDQQMNMSISNSVRVAGELPISSKRHDYDQKFHPTSGEEHGLEPSPATVCSFRAGNTVAMKDSELAFRRITSRGPVATTSGDLVLNALNVSKTTSVMKHALPARPATTVKQSDRLSPYRTTRTTR